MEKKNNQKKIPNPYAAYAADGCAHNPTHKPAHNPMITDVGLCALANSPLMDSLELLHIGRPGGFDCKFTQDGIDAVYEEMKQMHDLNVFVPVDKSTLTTLEL